MIKKSILLLKILFGIVILLCGFQIFMVFYSPVSIQVDLFALKIPLDITDSRIVHDLSVYILICSIPFYTLFLYIIKKLIDLFTPLTKNISPFTSKSAFEIRKIAYACFLYALIGTVVNFIGAQILINHFEESLRDWYTNLSLPVVSIFAGILVLSLAEIFDRGLMLQEENDSFL